MSEMLALERTPSYDSSRWQRQQPQTLAVRLPSGDELPSSSDKPVDNELQTLIPHLLDDSLDEYWNERTDWFFGINMGIYHQTGENPRVPIVPDGFLSL